MKHSLHALLLTQSQILDKALAPRCRQNRSPESRRQSDEILRRRLAAAQDRSAQGGDGAKHAAAPGDRERQWGATAAQAGGMDGGHKITSWSD